MDEASDAMLSEMVASIEGTQTLAIVNFRPEYTPDWAASHLPPGRARAARRGGHAGAAARPGRRGPLARRARRADPRAHPGQPLLHRGDRPRAGRSAATSRASAAPTGSPARSRTPACRPPCRRSSPRGSTGSTPTPRRCCRSPRWSARRSARERAAADGGARARTSSSRLLCELTEAGFLYEAEIYPERVLAFRHPLTREVAYGTQLADRRAADPRRRGAGDDRAQPRPPRRAGGADRPPHGGRRRDAGGGALVRRAPPTGPAAASPRTRCGSGEQVTELRATSWRRARRRRPWRSSSRLLQLDYAWRLGMDRDEEADSWSRRPRRSPSGPATCARSPC